MHSIHDSHLLAQALQLRGDSSGFHLDIQLSAHPDARQSDILRKMSEAAGFELEVPTTDVWHTRERLFKKSEAFVLKLTMPATAIAGICDYLARCEAKVVAQSVGIAHAEIPAPNHNSVMDIEILDDLLEKDGGALTFLCEPQSLQHDLKTVLGEPATLPLMREIKRQFDPNRTLNPGRFLGGI
jgi:glycolate oxidase FAD binding subunit